MDIGRRQTPVPLRPFKPSVFPIPHTVGSGRPNGGLPLRQRVRTVAGDAFALVIGLPGAVTIMSYTAVRGNPDASIPRRQHPTRRTARISGRASGNKVRKLNAIEASDTHTGGDPQISITGLPDSEDSAGRQTIVRRPDARAILRRQAARVKSPAQRTSHGEPQK